MRKASIFVVIALALVLLASCATKVQAESSLIERLDEAATYIQARTEGQDIQIGIVLGSGLGDIANEIESPIVIDYKDIPNFPVSTVEGHAGKLVIGRLEGKNVVCMQGRIHYYEGYEMDQIAFPIQVMKRLGAECVIITNSSGCINADWEAGELMLITDHIKLYPENPLRGRNEDEVGERFFDLNNAYDANLQGLAREQAKSLGIKLREGVYMYFAGPNYQTPAETRAAIVLGADAVGMSTVPEVIAAAHCGLKVLGISCMTTKEVEVPFEPISHELVLEISQRANEQFAAILKAVVRNM